MEEPPGSGDLLEPFDVEETIEIDPTFDVSVEESAFAYEPPSQ